MECTFLELTASSPLKIGLNADPKKEAGSSLPTIHFQVLRAVSFKEGKCKMTESDAVDSGRNPAPVD